MPLVGWAGDGGRVLKAVAAAEVAEAARLRATAGAAADLTVENENALTKPADSGAANDAPAAAGAKSNAAVSPVSEAEGRADAAIAEVAAASVAAKTERLSVSGQVSLCRLCYQECEYVLHALPVKPFAESERKNAIGNIARPVCCFVPPFMPAGVCSHHA